MAEFEKFETSIFINGVEVQGFDDLEFEYNLSTNLPEDINGGENDALLGNQGSFTWFPREFKPANNLPPAFSLNKFPDYPKQGATVTIYINNKKMFEGVVLKSTGSLNSAEIKVDFGSNVNVFNRLFTMEPVAASMRLSQQMYTFVKEWHEEGQSNKAWFPEMSSSLATWANGTQQKYERWFYDNNNNSNGLIRFMLSNCGFANYPKIVSNKTLCYINNREGSLYRFGAVHTDDMKNVGRYGLLAHNIGYYHNNLDFMIGFSKLKLVENEDFVLYHRNNEILKVAYHAAQKQLKLRCNLNEGTAQYIDISDVPNAAALLDGWVCIRYSSTLGWKLIFGDKQTPWVKGHVFFKTSKGGEYTWDYYCDPAKYEPQERGELYNTKYRHENDGGYLIVYKYDVKDINNISVDKYRGKKIISSSIPPYAQDTQTVYKKKISELLADWLKSTCTTLWFDSEGNLHFESIKKQYNQTPKYKLDLNKDIVDANPSVDNTGNYVVDINLSYYNKVHSRWSSGAPMSDAYIETVEEVIKPGDVFTRYITPKEGVSWYRVSDFSNEARDNNNNFNGKPNDFNRYFSMIYNNYFRIYKLLGGAAMMLSLANIPVTNPGKKIYDIEATPPGSFGDYTQQPISINFISPDTIELRVSNTQKKIELTNSVETYSKKAWVGNSDYESDDEVKKVLTPILRAGGVRTRKIENVVRNYGGQGKDDDMKFTINHECNYWIDRAQDASDIANILLQKCRDNYQDPTWKDVQLLVPNLDIQLNDVVQIVGGSYGSEYDQKPKRVGRISYSQSVDGGLVQKLDLLNV